MRENIKSDGNLVGENYIFDINRERLIIVLASLFFADKCSYPSSAAHTPPNIRGVYLRV